MLVPLATSGTIIPNHKFWSSIYLYHDRPHIINRKLSGVIVAYVYKITYQSNSHKLSEIINYSSITYEANKISDINKFTVKYLVADLLLPYDKNVKINEIDLEELKNSNDGDFITVRILFSSNVKSKNTVEVVLFDKTNNSVKFVAGTIKDKFTLVAPPFPYTIELTSSGLVRIILDIEDADTISAEWLVEKLFPKLLKWAEEYDETLATQASLSLISVGKYCELYKDLKAKYGKKLIDIWPENTDPLKFVHEDIAIVSYLICLWVKTHPNEKPSFVDLGCGNGLLVYLLHEEGYSGYGIDVRARKIWDMYPKSVDLRVETIVPSNAHLYPNTDWIIGNHSDELTPWIPVIAARSSYKTNFFLLPCCCYNFDGSKYIRKKSNISQYSDYLEYIEGVCKTCCFNVSSDKLRIPSTKRSCLVSFGRTYNREEVDSYNASITNMISRNNENEWCNDFQPRQSSEKVRNCTKLNRDLITRIVSNVVLILLKNVTPLQQNGGNSWNKGSEVTLAEISSLVHNEDLKQLKSECGGLQTLLRNHRYIFEINKGAVKLRVPPLLSTVEKYKSKPCWFLKNHPDGCLNDGNSCAYSHEM